MRWLTCLTRTVLLLAVVLGCGVAALVLYGRWLGSGETAVGAPLSDVNLSAIERVYLQTLLNNQADALQQPAGVGTQPVAFTISPGETADLIATNLAAAQLITDEALFLTYLRYYGLDDRLEAGEFLLSPQATIPELAASLADAVAQQTTVRFVEGWRLEEMADYLRETRPANVDAAQFLNIVQRRVPFDLSPYDFLSSLPPGATLEGFLFPDTYHLAADADALFLVDLMLRNFGNRVTPTMRQAYGVQGLSLREAVTLAAIVEREAVLAEERPLIAGVFYNRLAQEIPLGADPTVQYPLGYQSDTDSWWKSPLFVADLERDTPYNTYIHTGLPPGPIANPGLSSLQAVANPTETPYIFFVADCGTAVPGSHLFSITYEEHLVNVSKCQ